MEKGFTVIEFLVVMVLIGILSSVLFLARGTAEKRLSLQMAAFTLAQDFRDVQEMAMGAGESVCSGGDKTFVFGLYFDKGLNPDSYLVFADCNGNKKWQPADNDLGLRDVVAKKDVQICGLSENKTSIAFAPPEPTVFVNGTLDFLETAVTLCLKSNPAIVIKVKVNSAGRITIE